jgi:hypothetical protein
MAAQLVAEAAADDGALEESVLDTTLSTVAVLTEGMRRLPAWLFVTTG